MNYCDIGTATIAYRITKPGPVRVVIEGSLCSCGAEWWDFCEALGVPCLAYDRAGYGESSPSTLGRTGENAVKELEALLGALGVDAPFMLVGHSQGGLYATLFALRNPGLLRGLVLLDPLSTANDRFARELSPAEYRASGADKTLNLKIMKALCAIGLGRPLRALVRNMPPLCYHSFSPESKERLLRALTRSREYATALLECGGTADDSASRAFAGHAPIAKPMTIITHASAPMISDIKLYGNATEATAAKVEALWQDIMARMGEYGTDVRRITAPSGTHYAHLTDAELVAGEIGRLLARE